VATTRGLNPPNVPSFAYARDAVSMGAEQEGFLFLLRRERAWAHLIRSTPSEAVSQLSEHVACRSVWFRRVGRSGASPAAEPRAADGAHSLWGRFVRATAHRRQDAERRIPWSWDRLVMGLPSASVMEGSGA
jgi:hypothetical protein